MARATRASVSMTSGQGVSRLSYQRGYALKGDSPSVKSKFSTGETSHRQYGKTKSPEIKGPGINVDYEHTIPIRNLDSVEKAYSGKPRKSGIKLSHRDAKKLK